MTKINKNRNHWTRRPAEEFKKAKKESINPVIVQKDEPKPESKDDSIKFTVEHTFSGPTPESVKEALGGKSEGKIGDVWHKIKAGQVITGATRKEVREAAKAI